MFKVINIIFDDLFRMACVEYMKSFYFDMYFKTDSYSHILADVIIMCNKMIETTYKINTEVLNEVLELYRLIVDKYSGSQVYLEIAKLANFLKQIWDFFIS